MSSLTYNNVVIKERDDMLSLTDMWRAAGAEESRRPVDWLRLASTEAFVDHISSIVGKSHDEIIQTVRGTDAGTWAHWQIGMAYAKYLSPNFHVWCNQVVRDHMESRSVAPVNPPVMLPAQVGETTIDCMMNIATKYGVPKSYAIQVAAAEATRQTGMPWDNLLTQAEAMNNVPDEELLLEPTALGKLFEMSGVAMNKWLAAEGLQTKVGGVWTPTDKGTPLCQRHAWVKGSQSGYNLKWKVAEIENMMYQG